MKSTALPAPLLASLALLPLPSAPAPAFRAVAPVVCVAGPCIAGAAAAGGEHADGALRHGRAPARALHPNDGPDADVRIRIGEEAVVFHVMLNLAFVDEVVPSIREDVDRLDPAEHGAYRALLLELFREDNRVVVDGVEVTPLARDFEAIEADPKLLPLFPNFGPRALSKVRIELAYPVKAPPRSVAMTWGSFPPDRVLGEDAPPVRITAQLDAEVAGVTDDALVTFTFDEPEHTWHAPADGEAAARFLPVPSATASVGREVPLLSVGFALAGFAALLVGRRGGARLRRAAPLAMTACLAAAVVARDTLRVPLPGAGPRLPGAEEARAIFEPLHANIYRAFDYREEEAVYDALARSVEGELLDELYNEVYRGLVLQEAGGAVSRVQAVDLLEARVDSIGVLPPDQRPGFEVDARWQVEGAVFHWGHAHSRRNEYRAAYTVRAGQGGWRIAASRTLEQFRVDAAPLAPEDWRDAWDGFGSVDEDGALILPGGVEDL